MNLDLTGVITIEQQAREIAIVTDERLKLAALTLADWKEPMDKANEDLQARLAAIKTNWQEENAELIQDYEAATTAFADADKTHRSAIVKLYEAQADPSVKSNIIPGWGVAVSEDIQVDEPTAVQWLIEHDHKEALKLDPAKFKKLAEVLKPDFVTFRPKVIAKLNPAKGAK